MCIMINVAMFENRWRTDKDFVYVDRVRVKNKYERMKIIKSEVGRICTGIIIRLKFLEIVDILIR